MVTAPRSSACSTRSSTAGATVVMVTHDPVAASRADRVVFLADGRIAGEIFRPQVDAVAARMAHLADRGQAAAARTEPSW